MDLWTAAKTLFAEHMLLAIAVVLFVEELGIPLLVPSDVLMLLAGIEIARGNLGFGEVLLTEIAVTLAGATLLFGLSRRFGRPLLHRYGAYVGLEPERVGRYEARLARHQFRAVVLGRLTPGLRIVVVVAAGLAGLRPGRFVPALAAGAFLYLLGYTVLGMVAGDAAIALIDRLSVPASASTSLVALVGLALGLRSAHRRGMLSRTFAPSPLTDLASGVIAGGAGLLASNVVRGAILVWSRFEPQITTPAVEHGRLVALLLTWPGFLAVALVLAVAGPALGLRRTPRGVRVAIRALVPFLLTMLVVDPALSGGLLGWDSRQALEWALVSAARSIGFAITLELLEPETPRSIETPTPARLQS